MRVYNHLSLQIEGGWRVRCSWGMNNVEARGCSVEDGSALVTPIMILGTGDRIIDIEYKHTTEFE